MKGAKAASKLEEFFAAQPPIPGFDCLKMKDEAQAQILAELAGMTPEEELAYWAGKYVESLACQAKLRAELEAEEPGEREEEKG